jgi:Mor family transcriptional regulator
MINMRESDFFELVDFTQRTLGINDHQTQHYANELSRTFSGERVRIPNHQRLTSQRMADEIRQQYDGNNGGKLARQYGISRQRLHQILNE